MNSPGTFTNGELTFTAGDTIVLNHCRVWISWDGPEPPQDHYMSGLFSLEDYQPVDRAAYCNEAGWNIYPVGEIVIDGDTDRRTLIMLDGVYMFASMEDLFPQLDPNGYASMLVQEKQMDLWEELEMSGM